MRPVPMNLLAVFCYITLACDQSPGTQQAAPAVPAQLQTRAPASTSRTPASTNRSPAVALAVDGGNVAQQLLQQQRGKTVRETELSTYPTRYDYIDVEAVMNNERIIKILFNCVLNRGPCTREGLELKSKPATSAPPPVLTSPPSPATIRPYLDA